MIKQMKIIVIFLLLVSSVFVAKSQEIGELRAGIELGLLIPHEGGAGSSGAFELKYNIQDRMNIGLRTETVSFFKHKSYSARLLSFLATYDYYFNSKDRLFVPFCGAGLGYYFCDASDYSVDINENVNAKYNNPTCLLRLGAEIGKFRMSLTYNVIRKHSEPNKYHRNSDNITLNFGFYIGGGKWKK